MTRTVAPRDTNQVVSVSLVAQRDYPWGMGQLVAFLEGLDDLFWLAAGGEPLSYEGERTYAPSRNAITLDGTEFQVRRLSLNSPLEVTVDIVQHGGVYAASAATIAGSVVAAARSIIDLRTRWAASNADIAHSRLRQESYDLMRVNLAPTPPSKPVSDPEELERRIEAAADSVLELREARTTT